MHPTLEKYLHKVPKEFLNLWLYFSYGVTLQVAQKRDLSFLQDGKMIYWVLGLLAITPLFIFVKEKLSGQSDESPQKPDTTKSSAAIAHELVINYKSGSKASGIIACGLMLVLLSALLWLLRTYSTGSVFLDYVVFGAQFLIVPLIGLFAFGVLYGLVMLGNNEPRAVLSADGIRVKNFGFILWSDVEAISLYYVKGMPIESVALRVYDLSKVSRQATLSGKLGIFLSKLFKYPPIIISNTDCENDEILRFAHQYVEKKDTDFPLQRPTSLETKTSDIIELMVLSVVMTLVLQLFSFPFIQIMWINFLTGPAYIFIKHYRRAHSLDN